MRAASRMIGALLLAAGCVAAVAWAARDTSAAAPTGCAHPTPLRKTIRDGKSVFIAQLANYDVVGLAGSPNTVVVAPLYPRYPTALLVGGIGLEARHKLSAPVTVTASYCTGGRVRLFSFTGTTSPSISQPASAAVIQRTGYTRVTLRWPPPISSPPDKPQWMLTTYFYKPGFAVLRFVQAGRVIDRLTFKVCVARGPRLACR